MSHGSAQNTASISTEAVREEVLQRILIADDHEPFRRSLRRLLERAGHQVHEAADGVEAIAVLQQQPIDVVLLDILLPGKDGLETMREIRAAWPRVKVIAMSGGGMCGAGLYLDMSLKLGAAQILQKPFPFAALQGALRKLLQAPAQPAADSR